VKEILTEIAAKVYIVVYIYKGIVTVISVINQSNVIKKPQAPLQTTKEFPKKAEPETHCRTKTDAHILPTGLVG